MRPVLDRLPHGARVAIIRLRSLGDCVLTTPSLQLLKAFRPDLQIGLVVEPRFAPLFQDHPAVDQILPPSLPALARFRADLCVNLHGGGRSRWLSLASRARWRAGFAHFRPLALYNVVIPRAQEILKADRTVHTAEHLASAMFYLGVPQAEIPRASLVAPTFASAQPYAVLHPFASQEDKTWPAERFLALADHLSHHAGLEPIFIGAPGDDLQPFARFRTHQEPLRHTMSLLRSASLFIGNDSGPAHMAAAFGVPLIVFFGSSDPSIWHPWKVQAETLTSNGSVSSIGLDVAVDALQRLRVTA